MVSTIDDDLKAIAEIPEVKGRDPGETLSDLVLKYTSLKASLEQVRTAAPVRIVCTSIDSLKRPEAACFGLWALVDRSYYSNSLGVRSCLLLLHSIHDGTRSLE